MNIAIFSDCYLDLTGGIVTSINAQKSALEAAGHTVYIFSTGYPKSDQELKKLASQNIFQVPSCKLLFRGLTPVSRRPGIIEEWLLREHPVLKSCDIFYIHYESGCSIAGLRLGKQLKIPTVQVMHGREDMGEASIIPHGFRTLVATLLNWFHSWYIPHPIKVRRDDHLANTTAKATLENTTLNQSSDILVKVTSDCWGNAGKNGGDFTLNAQNQQLKGQILANNISKVTLNLGEGSTFSGTINNDNQAEAANISLTKGASWQLTADAYVTTITDEQTDFSNIVSNKHNIYYDKENNPHLNGRTINLPGGGKLKPMP